jgi:hypothetical protein
MRKLRAEMRRRMLGNGYCARPLRWTATSSRSAGLERYLPPPSSSDPPFTANGMMPPTRGKLARQKIFDGLLSALKATPREGAPLTGSPAQLQHLPAALFPRDAHPE